jgi:chaperonin cofactor prefoldin
MGLIWDLIQHNQISETRGKTDSLESRVTVLENQLQRTNETLVQLLRALETRFGDDLDGDGRIG